MDEIRAACQAAGVVPGMYFAPPGIETSDLIGKGFKFFTFPWGGWAAEGIPNGLANVK